MSKKGKKLTVKQERKLLVTKFSSAIMKASKAYGVDPAQVTKGQYGEYSDLSEWDLRKIGGFNVKKALFPYEGDLDLASISDNGKTKRYISKLEKELGNIKSFEEMALSTIKSSIKDLNIKKVKLPKKKKSKNKKMTMELQLSDIHFGKKSEEFDLDICRERLQKLTSVFLGELEQKEKSFNVEKIVIALLGDIIESYHMHGQESALSCEFNTPKQVQESIQSLFWDTIYPIALTGIDIVIPAVTGNHDRVEHKKTLNNPGENNLTWIIYNTLLMLVEAHNLKNVEFIIPRCGFTSLNIYGSNVLYEHGDELKNPAKDTILKHMEKRGRQLKLILHMSRFGHWHEAVCFDRGRAIINESVCGQDSYAREKGFDSTAGQTINYYVETDNRPTSFYYSFPVWLG